MLVNLEIEDVHAKIPSVNTIIAESPAESPSKPSVRLLEFETEDIINIMIGIKIIHIRPVFPLNIELDIS